MIAHHNLARLAALALSLLLAGCFTSNAPKFPLTSAVPALGEGGHYVGYERGHDGRFTREEDITVRHRPDGGYDFIDSKGKVTPVSLHRIGTNLFVAQAAEDSTTNYAVVRIDGGEVFTYAPSCDLQDAARMKALGVVIHDHECKIDAVADPAGLFATLDLGPPTSKLVKE